MEDEMIRTGEKKNAVPEQETFEEPNAHEPFANEPNRWYMWLAMAVAVIVIGALVQNFIIAKIWP